MGNRESSERGEDQGSLKEQFNNLNFSCIKIIPDLKRILALETESQKFGGLDRIAEEINRKGWN